MTKLELLRWELAWLTEMLAPARDVMAKSVEIADYRLRLALERGISLAETAP